jgi:hypothetical protein
LQTWVLLFLFMEDDPPPVPAEMIAFEIADGSVVGEATQEETEAFAADLQGLRHFGRRMGLALDLGEPWHGGFRESDFTLLWTCTSDATDDNAPAKGGVVPKAVPYFELISTLTEGD